MTRVNPGPGAKFREHAVWLWWPRVIVVCLVAIKLKLLSLVVQAIDEEPRRNV